MNDVKHEQIILDALDAYRDEDAITALDQIITERNALRERALPEAPEGWHIGNVYQHANYWTAVLLTEDCDMRSGVRAEGATPKDAVLAAINMIGARND